VKKVLNRTFENNLSFEIEIKEFEDEFKFEDNIQKLKI
jgi:hypothetical protein